MKVLGSKCFQCLRAYCKSRLDSKSIPCVFLGYLVKSDGYLYHDSMIEVTYTSRDVRFLEEDFSLNNLLVIENMKAITNNNRLTSKIVEAINFDHRSNPISDSVNVDPRQDFIDPRTNNEGPISFNTNIIQKSHNEGP